MGFQPLSLICGLETTINQSFLSMGFQPLQISSLWAQNHRATFCGLKTTKQLHFVDLQPLFFKKSRNYYRFLWVPFLSGMLWLFFTILAALCHGYFHTSSLCRATTLGIHPFFNRGSICVAKSFFHFFFNTSRRNGDNWQHTVDSDRCQWMVA